MNWHPHTEKPIENAPVFTALLARKGDDDEFYILSCPHYWKDGEWIEEVTGETLDSTRPFWWIPENEILQSLQEDWCLKV